jgi:Bacterial PH domain
MSSASATHCLPERLPTDDTLLWQGQPAWRSLAIHVFHARKIAMYFGLLLGWRLIQDAYLGMPASTLVSRALPLVTIAVAAVGIALLLAWLYARTTTYTVTSRRVFICYGAALPMRLNIPFRFVGAAAVKIYRDGAADIPLLLIGDQRLAYLLLWPHARPWRLQNPQPMLRCVADGARVAALLESALKAPPPPQMAVASVDAAARQEPTNKVPKLAPAAA